MLRHRLLASVALAGVLSVGVVGYRHWAAERAAIALLEGAEERLGASLVAAPELDRIQASTALSQLERAGVIEGRQLEFWHPRGESIEAGDP